LKSLLTNLLHRWPLKTTSRAAGWAPLLYMVVKSDRTVSRKLYMEKRVYIGLTSCG